MRLAIRKISIVKAGVLSLCVVLLVGCSMFRTPTVNEVSLTVDERGYAPAMIETTSGTVIRLTLNNVGTQEHQFAIDKIALELRDGAGSAMAGMNMPGMEMGEDNNMPQVHLVASAGNSTTLEFIPVQSGEYEFTCILPNHSEQGVLIVNSPS